ncbi:MAG: hypothetical protein ACOY3Y_14985 [Acidobacteriota bacterium]
MSVTRYRDVAEMPPCVRVQRDVLACRIRAVWERARRLVRGDPGYRRGVQRFASLEEAQAERARQALARFCAPRPPGGRLPWAELIARTFPDALDCPKCGGTLSVIAFITELAVVRTILAHRSTAAANQSKPMGREIGILSCANCASSKALTKPITWMSA